ncbi:thioesterase-like superfamily-domain-containing protein [Xylariaceae sp. FL1272]|nr:thioesterase-like superfamily-domain-containing protein [Xylariaceae sp. FL1272]
MSVPVTIESIIRTIPVPETDDDTFTNEIPFSPDDGGTSVFGGRIASQAITAAYATVPSDFDVYSSQSSFLRPASFARNITYRVSRAVDGRTYATREVRADQGGKCVLLAIISFQRNSIPSESVLTYQVTMPNMDGMRPEDVNENELLRHRSAAGPTLGKAYADEPFEWRPAAVTAVEEGDDPTSYRARGFFRSRCALFDKSANLAALAYASDKFFIGTALNANPRGLGDRMRNLSITASLTHNLSFHDPQVRVGDWLAVERETSWGANGRVIVHQKAWHVDSGRLVMDCTQEAVVWLKSAKL